MTEVKPKSAAPAKLVVALSDQAASVRFLKEQFAELLAGDQTLAADMIEGETGFLEALSAALVQIAEDEALAKARRQTASEIAEGARRIESRAEKLRAAVATTLIAAGETRAVTSAGTVSLKDAPVTAQVIDEAEVPDEFRVEQAPRLDKDALNKAIRERDIPGCTRSKGGKMISIRRG